MDSDCAMLTKVQLGELLFCRIRQEVNFVQIKLI